MKRLITFIFVLILLPISTLADTYETYLPVSSVWGSSRVALSSDSGYNLTKTTVGDSEALKQSNVIIESYPMDAYYVFSANMKSHRGLSKIAYILKDSTNYLHEDLVACKDTIIDSVKQVRGRPISETKSVAKWEFDNCTIEIGIGKFKNYTGSSNSTVGIFVKGQKISTAADKIIDSYNAEVPSPQVAMRTYMYNPIDRANSVSNFISGLYTINGLTYRSGSSGEGVSELQNLLISLGYLAQGDADGSYGDKTANAISNFQTANGLVATGEANLATQFTMVLKLCPLMRKDSCYISQAGRYAVVIWPLKAFYIGLVDGRSRFSNGTYYYVTGGYYTGSYSHNMRNGTGVARFPDGDVYIGDWVNDKMDGMGIYYFGGERSSTYYEGSMANNKMSGKGTYWLNGNAITGTWSKNQHKKW